MAKCLGAFGPERQEDKRVVFSGHGKVLETML